MGKGIGMENENKNIILILKVFLLSQNKILNMQREVFILHLKDRLHSLITLFTDWVTNRVTQSVKMAMCLCLEILDTFFVGNLFRSWIMLFKSSSVSRKSIST